MPVIEAVKNKGISGVGAAGFCWGGEFLSVNSSLGDKLI